MIKAALLAPCLVGLFLTPVARISSPNPSPSWTLRSNESLGDFYVVWRYNCVHNDHGDSAGNCTITQHSQTSCQDAIAQMQSLVQQNGDVCRHCPGSNVTDTTKHFSSGPDRITGGGACVGQ
jgi:hypothetical protein